MIIKNLFVQTIGDIHINKSIMKIILITDYTPTEDNFNGPSAITYHILKELKDIHDIYIYTTNANKVSYSMIQKSIKTFNGKLKVTPRNLWMKLLISRKTHFLFNFLYKNDNISPVSRYKLPKNILAEITQLNPDLILVYPYFLLNVQKQLCNFNIAAIGPDCYTLHTLRAFQDSYLYSSKNEKKEIKHLLQQITLEQKIAQYTNKIFLVGIEDNIQYQTIIQNKNKSFFLPHPHYNLKEKDINFINKKNFSVIITGKYDLYTYSDINALTKTLQEHQLLLSNFQFTFLGKTWKPIVEQLSKQINVSLIEWVEDYTKEIMKHDIQICPISLGTGTKGKVLDALANGLLCIGSKYAFENIAVKHNISCIQYKNVNEIPHILLSITQFPQKYAEIAQNGRQQIRTYHSPKLIADLLLKLAINNDNQININNYLQ